MRPVVVEKGVLPKNVDKDPAWRATAVFDRAEVVALISDPRLPEARRVLNALKALAAVRHGEAAGLCWRDYLRACEPLGKLVVSRSYEKARTKTQVSREIPVHPTLATILERWRDGGWRRAFGREPTDADLIVPGTAGKVWEAHDADDYFKDDLIELGLRHRRGHDLRRTFITLAQVDGARRDILKVITHGPSADDIVSLYTSFPWPTLCGEVAKLAIELPRLASVQVQGSAESCDEKGIESDPTAVTTVTTVPTTGVSDSLAISSRCPGMIRGPTVYEGTISERFHIDPSASSRRGIGENAHPYASSMIHQTSADGVLAALLRIQVDWLERHDCRELRRLLLELVLAIDAG